LDIRTGCSGWSYDQWVGPFYPLGTKPSDYLRIYSRIFDLVEIDSSFYGIPDIRTVENWNKSVPDHFLFTAKMPQTVTHELRLRNSMDEAKRFLDVIRILGEKLASVLIQLPPSLTFNEGFGRLSKLLADLPTEFRYSVEFRNDSWFVDETFSILRENSVALTWSEIPQSTVPPDITSDFVYLRFVGDRSISEKEFGRIKIDRSHEIEFWTKEIMEKKDMIRHAYVLSNNHFQGFGPGTVNLFRKLSGLEPVDWTIKTGQSRLI
jgi:uncharacterized protein YecE (DUF72 family)